MFGVIEGAKAGSEGQHTPTESPDTLHSVQRARIVDAISEGPIKGFVHGSTNPLLDVYLNETPVCNADGSLNFTDITIDSRSGTQSQSAMRSFSTTENETLVGVELRDDTPWVQAITNLDLDLVRLRIAVPQLQTSDTSTGDIKGRNIKYQIEVSTDGGAFVLVESSGFTGKTTSEYDRTHLIQLPTATVSGWQIRVTRLTPNADSAAVADTTMIQSYTEIVDAKLRYPNTALVGVVVDAKQFSNIPRRAYDIYGRIISVPSNYNPDTRVYTGVWDGSFKQAWTDNPVWIYYDLVTHTRYGLGQWVTASRINKWALYEIAQYCDELVPDGMGGMEPRFTCNLYLQQQAEAYKVLADLTSIFRGMAYWAGGAIQAVADMPSDPEFVYTNANVIGGKFRYAGSDRKTRYTVALVSWNDPQDFGRQKVTYVPDRDGIARYGIRQTSLIAVGSTSRGQAQRMGLWALLSSRLETESVSFQVGLDGHLVAPGRIARVADAKRAKNRQGGRIRTAASRTNLLPYSNDLSQWVISGATAGVGVAAPAGGTMTRLTVTTAGSTVARVQEGSAAVVGTQYVLSVTVRRDQHPYARFFGFGNGANGVVFNLATATATIMDSWDAAGVDIIDADYARIWAVVTPITSGTANIGLAPPAGGTFAGGEYLDFWGAQLELGSAPTPLIVTQAAAVSATTVTVDRAPDIIEVGGSLTAMLAAGTSETRTISAVDGSDVTVSPAFSTDPLPEAMWAVETSSLAAQSIRIMGISEPQSSGEDSLTFTVTGVQHNASKFDAVDFGAMVYEPPTVPVDGGSLAAPAAVSVTSYVRKGTTRAVPVLAIGWTRVTGATKYLLQYRRDDGEWSPVHVLTGNRFEVPGVEPGSFEAQVAAANGLAASVPTQSDPYVLDDSAATPDIIDDLQAQVDQASSDATAALGEITDYSNDNILVPVEKKGLITLYNVITTEKAGIDSEADAFAITGPKTSYDSAVTALTAYLATLVSPTAWNDVSGNTDITRTTFRTKWQDVYTLRQACLNAIYAAARQKAQDAQDEADQTRASAVVQNSNFTKNLNGWTFEATPGPVGSTEFQRGTTAANSPYAPIPTHLIHNGVGVETSAYAVNSSYIAVQAKQQVVGSVALRALSGVNSGARAQAFVRFYDKDGNYLGFLAGSPLLDPVAAPQLNSTVKGPAPTGAAFGRICILYSGHTAGVITATCAMLTATITDQDDLPDGSSYSRSMNGFHSETVDNATFSLPIDKYGNVPGWQGWQGPSSIGYAFDATYNANVLAVTTSGANQGVETVRKYACKPGDYISATLDLNTDVGASGAFFMIRFYQASGALVAGVNPKAQNSGFDTWETLTAGDVARAGSAYFTIILYTSTSSGRFLATNVRLSVNDTRVAGSGIKVGNQLNLPNSLVLNYGATRSATALTATSSGTVNVNAFTYYLGSTSVAYSAKSSAVTGLSQNSTYNIYCHDPSNSGGSKTWAATTNVNVLLQSYDDIVVAGQVTIPTSGSTGGGGTGPCPVVDAWVIRRTDVGSEYARAGSIRAGEFILKVDGEWGLVTYSERKMTSCVRVVAEEGRSLSCSRSAPLGLVLGGSVLAPDARRHLLAELTPEGVSAALIARVEDLPDQWVQHITCEDDFFWVGDHPTSLFSHHNLKP